VILGAASMPVGTPATTSVAIQATDAQNNIIVGPGGFTNPITLTITGDTNSTLTLSSASITKPGQVATLAYNGNSLAGATITASGTGLANQVPANTASFAASGVSVSWYQPDTYNNAANQETYLYPYGIAALPNGTAGVLFDAEIYNGSTWLYPTVIGVANSTAVQSMFTGDSSDPYNPAAPGSLTIPGVTVINGMNTGIVDDQCCDSYRLLAADTADAQGLLYYTASFSSGSDPLCPGGTAYTGLIGILNPNSASVHEIPLKGYPYQIRVDSSGNIWFTESSGNCSSSGNFLTSNYAVGEISRAGAITEVPYSTLGLPNDQPADMDITPDGKSMFIADQSSQTIIKIATAGWSSSTVALNNSLDPYGIAAAPDGTVAWFSDEDPYSSYYWGFVRGSAAFTTANLTEPIFPQFNFYSYSMNYSDGSFWAAGAEYGTGLGRLANVANVTTGTPVQGYIPLPYPDGDGAELYGVSAAGGVVWAWDDEYNNLVTMQYGAAKSGILNPASILVKRAGTLIHRAPNSADPHMARQATVNKRRNGH
jgi:streptogramin lyase